MIKKWMLWLLCCLAFFLSACSQNGEEDTETISGVFSKGQVLGYEYVTSIEQNSFLWKVGYKGEIVNIEESGKNEDLLEDFMRAVSEGEVVFGKLMISLAYFLVVIITTLILYKRNKNLLKKGVGVIVFAACISIFIAFDSAMDLNRLLHDAHYNFFMLKNS
ncbi:hypothetical protein EKG37_22415 [Robertmurraya yapensis]|uniref:Uncharacterized protein n=1 Tax=Bacillus yapensis TaxID=2492960 RepID=A0A3S0I5V0_9BACI|nr:hypothetical protein [Bacillus yapensis]RTR25845.1 hypothetical protein EKG37_22415 [Bacillus yapensis]TKS93511.1 hypothetical protein FAR12_22420 [Bacillus yapensis]